MRAHEPHPAIVLLHGCEGLVNVRGDIGKHYREWAELLAQWGYVAVLVDSFRPRNIGSICAMKDRPIQPWEQRTEAATLRSTTSRVGKTFVRIRFKPAVHNPGAPNGRGAHTGGQWTARGKAIQDTKRFLEQQRARASAR